MMHKMLLILLGTISLMNEGYVYCLSCNSNYYSYSIQNLTPINLNDQPNCKYNTRVYDPLVPDFVTTQQCTDYPGGRACPGMMIRCCYENWRMSCSCRYPDAQVYSLMNNSCTWSTCSAAQVPFSTIYSFGAYEGWSLCNQGAYPNSTVSDVLDNCIARRPNMEQFIHKFNQTAWSGCALLTTCFNSDFDCGWDP